MRRRFTAGWIVTYTVAVIMSLIVILPLLWIFLMSLKTPDEIIKWPPSVFFNSIIITFTSLAVAIALASISAYAISRLRPRGWKLLNFIALNIPLTLSEASTLPVLASQVRTDGGILWRATSARSKGRTPGVY